MLRVRFLVSLRVNVRIGGGQADTSNELVVTVAPAGGAGVELEIGWE